MSFRNFINNSGSNTFKSLLRSPITNLNVNRRYVNNILTLQKPKEFLQVKFDNHMIESRSFCKLYLDKHFNQVHQMTPHNQKLLMHKRNISMGDSMKMSPIRNDGNAKNEKSLNLLIQTSDDKSKECTLKLCNADDQRKYSSSSTAASSNDNDQDSVKLLVDKSNFCRMICNESINESSEKSVDTKGKGYCDKCKQNPCKYATQPSTVAEKKPRTTDKNNVELTDNQNIVILVNKSIICGTICNETEKSSKPIAPTKKSSKSMVCRNIRNETEIPSKPIAPTKISSKQTESIEATPEKATGPDVKNPDYCSFCKAPQCKLKALVTGKKDKSTVSTGETEASAGKKASMSTGETEASAGKKASAGKQDKDSDIFCYECNSPICSHSLQKREAKETVKTSAKKVTRSESSPKPIATLGVKGYTYCSVCDAQVCKFKKPISAKDEKQVMETNEKTKPISAGKNDESCNINCVECNAPICKQLLKKGKTSLQKKTKFVECLRKKCPCEECRNLRKKTEFNKNIV